RGASRTVAIPAAFTLALSLNLATCVRWLQQPDDGFAQVLSYMAAHVPAGARVTDAADAPPGPMDVVHYTPGSRYHAGLWLTPAARHGEHGRLVFSFRGRTYGNLALYRLPLP